MNLSLKKCKEMWICTLRTRPDFPSLLNNNRRLENLPSYKVLGLTLCNTLKWNDNINEIVTKTSKRLYILRVLKGAGVPPSDLLNVYFALIRSVLENWQNSLPVYLSDKIERAQKRALRILFANPHYNDALSLCKITRLDARCDNLCLRMWHSIRDHQESRLHRLLPPCVLRTSLTICAVVTNQPYQSAVLKGINVAFSPLSPINLHFHK